MLNLANVMRSVSGIGMDFSERPGGRRLNRDLRSPDRRARLVGASDACRMGGVNADGRVGRYEIRRVIGRGGMATVYLAYQSDLDRDVALKELRLGEASPEPDVAQRFLREARLASSL